MTTNLSGQGIEVRDLQVVFGETVAVDGVNLLIRPGLTMGLVGESGSGKSTVARSIVGLAPVASGELFVDGERAHFGRGLRIPKQYRKTVQMVFQDASSALNPRMTVGQLLEEPLKIHQTLSSKDRQRTVHELLDRVHLPSAAHSRFPRQFSGGQAQRIAIARALAVQPKYIVLDEVTSALDVSVQAVILNLLNELQGDLGIGYLFISHNLAVVKAISDEVAVMLKGKIVESGSADEVLRTPDHDYTKKLLDAVPSFGDRVAGEPSDRHLSL